MFPKKTIAMAVFSALVGIQSIVHAQPAMPEGVAPGAPGDAPVWAYSGKTGIGTSYEQYLDHAYSDDAATGTVSKVWFSVADGIITETMYGLIHEAQIKELQFLVKGDGFVDSEKADTTTEISYLHTDDAGRPLSLAYKIVNRDKQGKYQIEKHIFTDPDNNTLFVRVIFTANEDNITPYLYLNPHVNNDGSGDVAKVTRDALMAHDGGTHLTLKATVPFAKTSAGFVGASDGVADLLDNGVMDWSYAATGDKTGNVAMTAQLPTLKKGQQVFDFAVGFGKSEGESAQAVEASFTAGYDKVLAHYNGEGEAIGWEDYLASLEALPGMVATTTDNGKLLYTSAMVLKAQEDKTHAGALIASLSNPWGDTVSAAQGSTGYKAVWPRDFYQCSMALLALGDEQTPLVAFEYLKEIQVGEDTPGNKGDGGWFLQKTHVDGQVEWVGVQLDQTAMPIMLGWKLWQAGILSEEEMKQRYSSMLRPAADFLVDGGKVNIDWNNNTITPPRTQQERWEEQAGYSPSTTAAIISGLVTAADMAAAAGDEANAKRYLATADRYAEQVESTMFTTTGAFKDGDNNGRYFVRITQNADPNDHGKLYDNNGRPGMDETKILDAGFLELVRYGVRAADDPHITDSLTELDDTSLEDNLRVKYLFTFEGEKGEFPGWRRYGNDGYGEDEATGGNYYLGGQHSPGQRGRVWPFFTGERGHYELASAKSALGSDETLKSSQVEGLRNTYIKGMELFANEGMMLPEQVWDGVGENSAHHYVTGEGTDSATPLAWTHAEYIKLVRSISDQQVWDNYPLVSERYAAKK